MRKLGHLKLVQCKMSAKEFCVAYAKDTICNRFTSWH